MTDSVLAHIARGISQKENVATDALAFVLNRSPAAREALRRQIAAIVGDLPAIARVATQIAVGEESRPDVLVHGEDGATLGYLEAKFWAALTNAQPTSYVDRLSAAGGGVLVIVAPERRMSTLHLEVRERLRAASPKDSGPRALSVGSVRIGLLSWSKLLASVSAAVADDPAAASDVGQLVGLVARFESRGFIPFTRDELDDLQVPRRIQALGELVDEIVDRAAKLGVLNIKRMRHSRGAGHVGRYVGFSRAGAWLGLAHTQWGSRGRTPFWLRFDNSSWGRGPLVIDALRAWTTSEPPRAYADDGATMRVPLLVPVGVEKDAVIDEVLRQLREVDEALTSAGLPLLEGAAPAEE